MNAFTENYTIYHNERTVFRNMKETYCIHVYTECSLLRGLFVTHELFFMLDNNHVIHIVNMNDITFII